MRAPADSLTGASQWQLGSLSEGSEPSGYRATWLNRMAAATQRDPLPLAAAGRLELQTGRLWSTFGGPRIEAP
jgi:hypothetical protein